MRSFLIALTLAFITTQARAVLITPTGVTEDAGGHFSSFVATHLIDDSGLSGAANMVNYTTITHAPSGGAVSWVTPAFFPDYFAGGGTTPVHTFDLGGTFDLTDVVAWNYGCGGGCPGNAAETITATFSTTGTGGAFGSPTTFILPFAEGPAHTVSLGGTIQANAVRFTYDTNRVVGAGGDRIGLSELKFIGSAPVPEASTCALAILGLFGLGRSTRRRAA